MPASCAERVLPWQWMRPLHLAVLRPAGADARGGCGAGPRALCVPGRAVLRVRAVLQHLPGVCAPRSAVPGEIARFLANFAMRCCWYINLARVLFAHSPLRRSTIDMQSTLLIWCFGNEMFSDVVSNAFPLEDCACELVLKLPWRCCEIQSHLVAMARPSFEMWTILSIIAQNPVTNGHFNHAHTHSFVRAANSLGDHIHKGSPTLKNEGKLF